MNITIILIIVLALLALALGVILVLILGRNRQPAETTDLAREFQAVREAQTQSLTLVQQQLDNLRAHVRESLDGNTAHIYKRLETVDTRLQGVSQNVNAQLTGVMEQVNTQLNAITTQVNDRIKENTLTMQQTHKTIGERLENTTKVMGSVEHKLGQVEEINRHIHEVGKDIAGLQEILRAPKIRGTLGELFLGDLLAQILPPTHFTLQHTFKSGEKVDAVIRLGQGMVPVDAKFPLENFKRLIQAQTDEERAAARKIFAINIKKHVDDIASKYILPDEGTFDFALMYIPAENVYYETIIKDEALGTEKSLSEYALTKRVIPVSPNSFYAYLQAIVLGLKGLRIEESARDIMRGLDRMRSDFARLAGDFTKLGKHIHNASQTYENTEKRLSKIRDKVARLGGANADELQLEEETSDLPADEE